MQKNKNEKPFKSLIIKDKYKNYDDFYSENKTIIYKSILNIFKEFKTTSKENLTFYISAKIKNEEWDTEFKFHKKESIILKRDLIPYFEEIEDYETCIEIKNLYKELTS